MRSTCRRRHNKNTEKQRTRQSRVLCYFISVIYSLFVQGYGRFGRVRRSFRRFRLIWRLGARFLRGIWFRCVGRFRFLLRRDVVLFRHIGRCNFLGRVLLRCVRRQGILWWDFLRGVFWGFLFRYIRVLGVLGDFLLRCFRLFDRFQVRIDRRERKRQHRAEGIRIAPGLLRVDGHRAEHAEVSFSSGLQGQHVLAGGVRQDLIGQSPIFAYPHAGVRLELCIQEHILTRRVLRGRRGDKPRPTLRRNGAGHGNIHYHREIAQVDQCLTGMDDLVRGHASVHVYLQAIRIKDDLAAAGDQDVDQVFRGHRVRLGVLQGFVFGFRLLNILLRACYVFRRLGLVRRHILRRLSIFRLLRRRGLRGLYRLAQHRGEVPLRCHGRCYPLKRQQQRQYYRDQISFLHGSFSIEKGRGAVRPHGGGSANFYNGLESKRNYRFYAIVFCPWNFGLFDTIASQAKRTVRRVSACFIKFYNIFPRLRHNTDWHMLFDIVLGVPSNIFGVTNCLDLKIDKSFFAGSD